MSHCWNHKRIRTTLQRNEFITKSQERPTAHTGRWPLLFFVSVHMERVNATAYAHLESPAAMAVCSGFITVPAHD